jgi:hypothetical protein
VPALPSSPVGPALEQLRGLPAGDRALLAGKCPDVAEHLARVPGPRKPRGVRYTLTSLLLAAIAAVLAGAQSLAAVGEWVADAPPQVLAGLGIRRDPLTGRFEPPDEATIRRVLDSTPLYDAVATMDTVTLIRSAIRGLLGAADPGLEQRLRAVLTSGDQYVTAGKPVIDWDDKAARTALVDARARDGYALLQVLEGQKDLPESVNQAARLLATVLGQDLEPDPDNPGGWRIARRVAKDRVISTVDTEARHGHKTNHRNYDGYKGHAALDPDSEIITAVAVTPGNTGDVEPVADLIADLTDPDPADQPTTGDDTAAVYGDAAYGAGEVLERLDNAGIEAMTKVQPPVAPGGKFTKDQFDINLEAGQVTCPNEITVPIKPVNGDKKRAGQAEFGIHCRDCPLADMCTTSKTGRSITIGHHEARLTTARTRQSDPDWKADYRATRPKVERKLAHLVRRRHGGRRARMRGTLRIAADFSLLAAAVNLARLAKLGLVHGHSGWTLNPA